MHGAGRACKWVARLTPSGALTEALTQAMTLSVDWFGIAVLAAWGAVARARARCAGSASPDCPPAYADVSAAVVSGADYPYYEL